MGEQASGRNQSGSGRRNVAVAVTFGLVAVGMLGMAYAAVPLYRMFCQVTGYGGTTQKAEQPSQVILAQNMRIRFDANVANGIPWTFAPVKITMDVKIGENGLAYYRATNLSDKAVTGTAAFNVTPEIAGSYFNKLACFCFTEQTLEPGQSVDMPVSFYVDPAIVKDADAKKLSEITLSYTFYPAKPMNSAAVKRPDQAKGG